MTERKQTHTHKQKRKQSNLYLLDNYNISVNAIKIITKRLESKKKIYT
jgi:hypothetical protein